MASKMRLVLENADLDNDKAYVNRKMYKLGLIRPNLEGKVRLT